MTAALDLDAMGLPEARLDLDASVCVLAACGLVFVAALATGVSAGVRVGKGMSR